MENNNEPVRDLHKVFTEHWETLKVSSPVGIDIKKNHF